MRLFPFIYPEKEFKDLNSLHVEIFDEKKLGFLSLHFEKAKKRFFKVPIFKK